MGKKGKAKVAPLKNPRSPTKSPAHGVSSSGASIYKRSVSPHNHNNAFRVVSPKVVDRLSTSGIAIDQSSSSNTARTLFFSLPDPAFYVPTNETKIRLVLKDTVKRYRDTNFPKQPTTMFLIRKFLFSQKELNIERQDAIMRLYEAINAAEAKGNDTELIEILKNEILHVNTGKQGHSKFRDRLLDVWHKYEEGVLEVVIPEKKADSDALMKQIHKLQSLSERQQHQLISHNNRVKEYRARLERYDGRERLLSHGLVSKENQRKALEELLQNIREGSLSFSDELSKIKRQVSFLQDQTGQLHKDRPEIDLLLKQQLQFIGDAAEMMQAQMESLSLGSLPSSQDMDIDITDSMHSAPF